jgi:hypothetical protein
MTHRQLLSGWLQRAHGRNCEKKERGRYDSRTKLLAENLNSV